MIRSSTNHKLQVHPTLPLAWAIRDNATIGTHFNEWLKGFDWATSADWYTAQHLIAQQLSMLNGNQRRLCQIAGKPASDSELCGVLIVGFRDRVGVVFEVDAGGFVSTKEEHEFHACGSGFVHANIAYQTLVRINSGANPEDKLRTIVGIAAENAPSCGPPVHMARVMPNGVTLLT